MTITTIGTTIPNGITLGTGAYADQLTVTSPGTVIGTGQDAGILGRDSGITLTNAGTLEGYTGVYLYTGNGTVVNETGGFISGALYGIQSGNLHGGGGGHAPSMIFNAGTINGGEDGIALYSGGNVTNTGRIIGNSTGVYVYGAGTLFNSGTIIGSNSHGAVHFTGHGDDRVILASTARFYGAVIGSSFFNTVELTSGSSAGTIANFNAEYEYFHNAVLDPNANWTIASNAANDTFDLSGVTQASIMETQAGGAVTFAAGGGRLVLENEVETSFSLASDGAGGTQITFVPGGVSTITAALTSPISFGAGIYNANLTVAGSGSIIPATQGVPDAVYASVNGVSLSNFGTIDSSGIVVELKGGGTVVNAAGGLISSNAAGPDGVFIYGAGVLSNAGNIFANNDGVALFAGGTVINTGTIHGVGNVGVYLAGGGTVENSGVLKGPQAVQFSGAETDTLIITPSAVFQGSVAGGSGSNTLELAAGSGAISGIGTQFTGFTQLVVESGANWVLNGANTIANISGPGALTLGNAASLAVGGSLAANLTLDFSGNSGTLSLGDAALAQAHIIDFITGDTIDLTGVTATEIGFGPGGLTFQVSGTDEALDITGNLGAANFAFVADGHGGTDITDNILTTLSSTLTSGITLGSGQFLDRLFISPTGAVKTSGRAGIVSGDAAASLVNYGTVSGASYAASFANGGVIFNAATLAGSEAVRMAGAGSVANSGVIKGGLDGVVLLAGGNVVNSGTIAGAANVGIYLEGGGTVTNGGTILGGVDAVQFKGAFSDRLIDNPGAVFTGKVVGGTGINTLELGSAASTGTLTGLGTSFTGFTQITLDAGAHWLLAGANTLAAGTTLSNAGNLTLASTTLASLASLVNDGNITLDPSAMSVDNLSGTGVVTIAAGATLDVLGSIAAGETISFAGTNAVLQITDMADIAGTLSGAGTLDITNLPFASFASASYNSVADLLGITFTGTGSPLELNGYFAGDHLAEQSDGAGGTELTETPLCYLHGTCILTPTGLVKVEDLGIGDAVVTRFGGVQRIKWLGRQNYAPAFIGNSPAKWPVRIAAGALADGVPARDLLVSPGHSMLLGGTLVLASSLVNGVTVTQTRPERPVHYVQIELGGHDCVLAEGAWSETFADAPGLRAQFHNAAEFYALYPDDPPPEALRLCAPRPESGPTLEAALRRPAARAAIGINPGPLEGWVDTAGDWRITGWARDLAHPELPVLLEILAGDQIIGTALACEFRDDLRQAGKGHCAFRFTPPRRLRAEALAMLTIRRARDGAALPGAGAEIIRRKHAAF